MMCNLMKTNIASYFDLMTQLVLIEAGEWHCQAIIYGNNSPIADSIMGMKKDIISNRHESKTCQSSQICPQYETKLGTPDRAI